MSQFGYHLCSRRFTPFPDQRGFPAPLRTGSRTCGTGRCTSEPRHGKDVMAGEATRPATDGGLEGAMSPLLDLTRPRVLDRPRGGVLSLVSALATYLILTGLTPIAPRNEVVLTALFFNVVLITAMIAVIAWQGIGMWRAWRAKLAGRAAAHAHRRCCSRSSPRCPPCCWRSPRRPPSRARSTAGSRTARAPSSRTRCDVAKAYVEEHGQLIRTDIVNMVRDIDAGRRSDQAGDSTEFQRHVMAQAGLRDLPAAYVIDSNGASSSRGARGQEAAVTSLPPLSAMAQAARPARCRC